MKHFVTRQATALLLVLMMLISSFSAVFARNNAGFADFPTGWSAEAVGAAVANGLLRGKTANTLDPTGNLTRAEMATIINRAFGATIEANISSFVDVSPYDWYYHEIAKAVNMRTFQGDGNNTMRPNDPITREEVFTVIARAIVLQNNDYTYLNKFNDGYLVSSWARPYATALVAKGYVNGDNLSNINPQSNISREEFAQIMHNIVKTYFSASGDYNTVTKGSVVIRVPDVNLSNMIIEGDLILGDGVGKGDVTLVNVIIKGRLLTRGGEGLVTLIRTTVGEGVVVNDYNGVVNFNNYKTDAPFAKLTENTPCTFIEDRASEVGGSISLGGGSGNDIDNSSPNTPDRVNKHTFTLNLNGGTITSGTTSVKIPDGAGILNYLPTPTKNNGTLTFGGWYKDSALTQKISDSDKASNSMSVYAKWIAVITFHNFNLSEPTRISRAEIKEGGYLTAGDIPACDDTDTHTFVGWYKEDDTAFDTTAPMTKNMHVYAKWNVEYTLTLITSGGTLALTDPIQEVIADNEYKVVVNEPTEINLTAEKYKPDKTDYTFNGWYQENSNQEELLILLDRNITLYADWIITPPETWEVTFITEEGESVKYVEKGEKLRTALGGDEAVMPLYPRYYWNLSPSTNSYQHTVPQVGWYDSSRTEYTLDTEINADVTLYAGWQLATAKFSTTRFNIPDIPTFSLFYSVDNWVDSDGNSKGRFIDAATDFIFWHRTTVLTALNEYEGKILNHPIAQKLFTTDRQLKIFKENLGLSQFFDSSTQIRERFSSQIREAIERAAGISGMLEADSEKNLYDKIEVLLYKALDDIIADDMLNLKSPDRMLDLELHLSEIFGSEENLRKMLKDETTSVLDSVTDPDLKDTLQDELDRVIEFIVKSDNNEILNVDKTTNLDINLGLKDIFGKDDHGNSEFDNMLDSEANNLLDSFPNDIRSEVKPVIDETIQGIKSDADGIWNVSSSAEKNISISRKIHELVGGSDGLYEKIKTEVDKKIGSDALDESEKTKLYEEIKKLAYKSAWNINGVYADESSPIGFVTLVIKRHINTLYNNLAATINGEIAEAFKDKPIDVTVLQEKITSLLSDSTKTLQIDKTNNHSEKTNGEADVTVKVSLDDVVGSGGIANIVETEMESIISKLPEYAKSVFEEVKNTAATLINGLSTTPLKKGMAGSVLRGLTITLKPTDVLDDLKNDVKTTILGRLNTAGSGVTFNGKDSDTYATKFVNDMFADDAKWGYTNETYNNVSVKANMLIKDAFGGSDGFANTVIDLAEDDINALSDGGSEQGKNNINNIKTAIKKVANEDTWSTKDASAIKADLKLTVKIYDLLDATTLSDITSASPELANALKEGNSFDVTSGNKFAVEEFKNKVSAINLTNYVFNAKSDGTLTGTLKTAVDYIDSCYEDETARKEKYSEIDSALDTAKTTYITALDAAIAGETEFNTTLDVLYELNVTEIFINTIKNTEISYDDFKDTEEIKDLVDLIGEADAIESASNTAIVTLQNRLKEDEPADGYSTKLDFELSLNLNKIFLEQVNDKLNSKKSEFINVTKYNSLVSEDLRDYLKYESYSKSLNDYITAVGNAIDGDPESISPDITFAIADIDVAVLILEEMKKEINDGVSANDYYDAYQTMINSKLPANINDYVSNDRIEYGFNKSISDYVTKINNAIDGRDSVGGNIDITITLDVAKILIAEMDKKVDSAVSDYDSPADSIWNTVKESINNDLFKVVDEADVKEAVRTTLITYQSDVKEALSDGTALSTEIEAEVYVNVNKLLIEGMEEYVLGLDYDTVDIKLFNDLKSKFKYGELEEAFDNLFADSDGSYLKAIRDAKADSSASLSGEIELSVDVNLNRYIVDAIGEVLNEKKEGTDTYVINYDDYRDILAKNATIKTIMDADEQVVIDAFNKALKAYKDQIENIQSDGSTTTEFNTNATLNMTINISNLVINGLIGKLNALTFAEINDKGYLSQNIIELLEYDYLDSIFEDSRDNMVETIEEGMKEHDLHGYAFHIVFELDAYRILLKKINEIATPVDYEFIKSKLPEQLINIVGDEILKTQINPIIEDLKGRVSEAYEANYADSAGLIEDIDQLDCMLRLNIDYINDILMPEYDRYIVKFEEKFGEYYEDVEELVRIKEIANPRYLLAGDPENKTDILTGYSLETNDFYYNRIEELTLLTDILINKASDKLVGTGRLNELVSDYVDLGFDYYKKLVELARKALERVGKDEDINIDEILPDDETLEKLRPKLKTLAVELVENPDMSVREAVELIFDFTDRSFEWDNINNKTVEKKGFSVTVNNKLHIPIPVNP